MVALNLLLFLLLIIIPDLYIDFHYFRHRWSWWKRILWWLPSLVLLGYTVYLAVEKNFIPDNFNILLIYLLLFSLIAVPKCVFALFSIAGLSFCKLFKKRNNYGKLIGLLCIPVIWFIILYGAFVGIGKLEIRHIDYTSSDLPASFDGYRICLFSDAHVGSFTDFREALLQCDIDSINAQKADLIVFTGDLQNIKPQDIYHHRKQLSSLRAKDGVVSILGNHDYAEYIDGDSVLKNASLMETISLERQFGWNLLLNERLSIKRGEDHIIIAGMENYGKAKRFGKRADITRTLEGTTKDDFIIMLEHDPYAWRHLIIPDGRPQLTLSGHTHAMQFKLFGWAPIALVSPEWYGYYQEGKQTLYVTAGIGALIPWRFNCPGEIVIITLHKTY